MGSIGQDISQYTCKSSAHMPRQVSWGGRDILLPQALANFLMFDILYAAELEDLLLDRIARLSQYNIPLIPNDSSWKFHNGGNGVVCDLWHLRVTMTFPKGDGWRMKGIPRNGGKGDREGDRRKIKGKGRRVICKLTCTFHESRRIIPSITKRKECLRESGKRSDKTRSHKFILDRNPKSSSGQWHMKDD